MLGLQTLRFFTALMPLVLRWCHDPDLAIQLGALQVLQEIVKGTWPRMNAHASSLWGHLQQILAQHDEDCLSRNSTEVLEHSVCAHSHIKGCLCKIAEMLFWCGGSELQQQLHALKQTGQCDARELLQNLPGVQEVAVA